MEVKPTNILNGQGLFSTKTYLKSEIIYTLNGETYNKPTKYTIHIGNNIHILDDYGRYMNHSFNPTTYIDKYNVIALIDINNGDELTFDYNQSEMSMATPFIVDNILVCGKSI